MIKILVVDDEEKMTRIYNELLKSEGYEPLEANDSHRATNLLITHKDIDLILLDIEMPKVDGVTLYEVAKQYNPQIKIVVTSVYSLEEQKNLIGQADDYYDKSKGTEILLAKIKGVLEQAGAAKTPTPASTEETNPK